MTSALIPSALFGVSMALAGYWWAGKTDSRLVPRRSPEDYPFSPRISRVRRLVPWTALAIGVVFRAAGLAGPLVTLADLVACVSYWLSWREEARKRKRIEEIKAQWPLMLDGMATASASGLDLRTAFQAACRRTSGALRQEMDKVSLRVAGGMSLSQALRVMEKDGISVARRLRAMLLQAEVLGTPVSTVLTALSQEADEEERHETEQRFNALPVKLSVVTVIFLLPPVLIVAIVPHLLVFLRSRW